MIITNISFDINYVVKVHIRYLSRGANTEHGKVFKQFATNCPAANLRKNTKQFHEQMNHNHNEMN